MAQGRFSVVAEVLPPMDRRIKGFAKHVIERTLQKTPTDVLELACDQGLVKKIHCTADNADVWKHLPVEAGDYIYQLAPEFD